jgi:hypothetical protein
MGLNEKSKATIDHRREDRIRICLRRHLRYGFQGAEDSSMLARQISEKPGEPGQEVDVDRGQKGRKRGPAKRCESVLARSSAEPDLRRPAGNADQAQEPCSKVLLGTMRSIALPKLFSRMSSR